MDRVNNSQVAVNTGEKVKQHASRCYHAEDVHPHSDKKGLFSVGREDVEQKAKKADGLQDGHVEGQDVWVARCQQGGHQAALLPLSVADEEDEVKERKEEEDVGDEEGSGDVQAQWRRADGAKVVGGVREGSGQHDWQIEGEKEC